MAHSAGARIVSEALASLGADAHPYHASLRQRLRLDEAYYAAADIEIKAFVRELKSYADLPMRVTLQMNRGDYVLDSRAGRPNFDELTEAERASLRDRAAASRLDIVDVSSERAGDLPGGAHAFWYERRWVSLRRPDRIHLSCAAGAERAQGDRQGRSQALGLSERLRAARRCRDRASTGPVAIRRSANSSRGRRQTTPACTDAVDWRRPRTRARTRRLVPAALPRLDRIPAPRRAGRG